MERIHVYYETKEYDKFSFIDGNREISETRVKNLIRSIKEVNLLPYKPILVTHNYKIIDGQHRFMACCKLNEPIYYIFLDDIVDEDKAIQKLNINQRSWRQEDYMNNYCVKGLERYINLRNFIKKYNMTLSNAMVIYCEPQINSSQLKNGNTYFSKYRNADKIAEFLKSDKCCALSNKITNKRYFYVALRRAFDKYNERQINKLSSKLLFIDTTGNLEQYEKAFENLIK